MAPKAKAKVGCVAKAKAKGKAKVIAAAKSVSHALGHVQFVSGTKDELKKVFSSHDTNGDGVMSLQELTALLKELDKGLSESDIKTLFEDIDKNKDDVLSVDEFLDYLFTEQDYSKQEVQIVASKRLPEEHLNRHVSDELKSLPTPPHQIQLVMQLTMAILDVPYDSYVSAQSFLSRKNWVDEAKALRGRLRAGGLPAEPFRRAQEIRQKILADVGEARILKGSNAAKLLWIWAVSVLEEFEFGNGSHKVTTVWGHELSAPSVYHLSGEFLTTLAAKGFKPDAKVYEIEEKILRGQGRDIICPRDSKMGAAYVDSIGKDPNDIGMATHMLSYSWGYRVDEIVDTLMKFARGHDLKQIYVWMCCLCINQHRVVDHQKQGSKVPFDVFQQVFHDRVSRIGQLVAMMAPWNAPLYITRVWCAFELYTATSKDAATVHIAMPPKEEASFVQALRNGDGIQEMWQVLGALDVKTAQASVPDDRMNILGIIEKHPGFAKFNHIVAKHLQSWIVGTSEKFLMEEYETGTRKSSNEICMLVSFMLQVGELFWRIGNGMKAEIWYDRALKMAEQEEALAGSMPTILRNLANIKHELGNKEQAASLMQRAEGLSKFDTSSSSDLLQRGLDKYKKGAFKEALVDFEQALALELASFCPKKAALANMYVPMHKGILSDIYMAMGGARASLRDLDGSEDAFTKVLELIGELGTSRTPKAATAWSNLGNTKANKKDFAGANDCYDKALEIHESLSVLEGMHGAKLLLNMGLSLWNAMDVEGAGKKGEHAMRLMVACGMQDSDCYRQAEKLAEYLSEQKERDEKVMTIKMNLEQTFADIEVFVKHDAVPATDKDTLVEWQAYLTKALATVEVAIKDPAVNISSLEHIVKFRDSVQGEVDQMKTQMSTSVG